MVEQAQTRSRRPAQAGRRIDWSWLIVAPFFVFVFAFLFWPTLAVVVQSFLDQGGRPTLDNVAQLSNPTIVSAYIYSLQLSTLSALGGGLLGLLLAYAITIGGLPAWMRSAVLTFSGIASNFAGVPLAFAFIATLGQLGLVTQLLKSAGIRLYPTFSLYSLLGLTIVYIYFQIPLMVLIMAPALEGMKREWREAAENLGASSWQYWRHVGLPILAPAILGTVVLLFGNAFGAHATAFALTGGGTQGTVITVLIGAQISSDAFANPNLGNAMALGMIVIMVVTITAYAMLQRWSERWLHR